MNRPQFGKVDRRSDTEGTVNSPKNPAARHPPPGVVSKKIFEKTIPPYSPRSALPTIPRSNKRRPAPATPRVVVSEVARVHSTNVIYTHTRSKPIVPTTIVVTPAVVPSGDRRCAHEQR